jgi:hypothetical protein
MARYNVPVTITVDAVSPEGAEDIARGVVTDGQNIDEAYLDSVEFAFTVEEAEVVE